MTHQDSSRAACSELPLECRTYVPEAYWKSDIPLGTSGNWVVDQFELPPWDPALADPERTSKVADFARHRPGTYTRLRHAASSTNFMSDLHEEWYTQRKPIQEGLRRGGHVLISGLGLGLIVECLLRTEDSPVEKVTVLEASADVIHLVAGHLEKRYGERLEIIHADAFAWEPPRGARYSVVWHDIWPNLSTVPESEVEALHQRFAPYCDWQDSWTLHRSLEPEDLDENARKS